MVIKHIKNAQHYFLLGKCKLKSQGDITTHLLKWSKLKRMFIPSAVEKWNDWNAQVFLVAMWKGATTLENSLTFSLKSKHTLT